METRHQLDEGAAWKVAPTLDSAGFAAHRERATLIDDAAARYYRRLRLLGLAVPQTTVKVAERFYGGDSIAARIALARAVKLTG